MSVYRYEYDDGGNPPDERGRYDEETRVVMGKNVSESLILDRLRSTMGPTATELHARQVQAELRRVLADRDYEAHIRDAGA